MITLHINTDQRDQIVEALRMFAQDLENGAVDTTNLISEAHRDEMISEVDDLRDMADLIEDAEDA